MRLLMLLALLPGLALAQDKKPEAKKDEKKLPRIAINDPAKLKEEQEFHIQGEFELKTDKVKDAWQVVARGNGDYALVRFSGGLPGGGWNGTRSESPIVAHTSKGKVGVLENMFAATIDLDGIKVGGPGSDSMTYKRVERKSPTLDAKPPEGAVVLFGGPDDLAKWEKAKVVELSDGKFLGVGGRTKQKFQSFTLHLEFRLPWMPNSTGQQRGNSGVYLQDRYELQVLDSFGLKGVDNECGGIYKESAPKVNMCLPPMVWQTYDIDFTAATFADGKKTKQAVISVKHNGVLIHDKLELKSNTPGGGITKEVPEAGSLYLQDHGDPVVYRNVWIVEKK